MDIEYHQELKNNNSEYKNGLFKDIGYINEDTYNPPKIYNPSFFQPEIIIKYLQNKIILKNNIICPECNGLMNLVKNNASCDKVIWRCNKINPKHDRTINIRFESIFAGFLIKIQIPIIFLLFYCISENITINSANEKCKEFCTQLGLENISKDSISKFYRAIRNKLREKMHSKWTKSFLGIEINPEFYSSFFLLLFNN